MAEKESVFYVNGEYVPESRARIPVTDHAVLFGDGVFDSLFVWDGFIHKIDAHLARLYRGAHSIKLEIPMSPAELKEVIAETVRRNGLRRAYIKVVVSRGVGSEPRMDPRGCTPSVIVIVGPYIHLVNPKQETGLRIKISSVRRIPAECLDAKIKSLNYLNLILARLEAIEAGVDEAILLDPRGFVCEGPGYNLFAVAGRTLSTPAENILHGITRDDVFELCQREGLPVRVANLTPYDLYVADEVFFCSSSVGITGVVEIDGRQIGTGKPGALTQRLQELFLTWIASGTDGYRVFG